MSRCRCTMAIATLSLLVLCSWALPSASAQEPALPQNHGIALAAGCESTTCIGSPLNCSVDITRNDVCGDAIIVHHAHAHVNDPNNIIPTNGDSLLILAASGNTTAVPGPFSADIYLGAPGDTSFGLPGDPNPPVVNVGFSGVPGDTVFGYIMQAGDPDPTVTLFHIIWEDTCNDFNHDPDCTDCPAGVEFEATTGAVAHPSPIPCCEISGPALVCPGAQDITYNVIECSDPPLTDVTFDWVITGDALFCDGSTTASGPTVCVDADLVCPGSYTLTVTVTTADGCTNTCSFTAAINDTTPPVLIGCPDDASFQCFGDVPPPADVTAEDNCDGLLPVDFSEDQSNPDSNCNNTITRTWTATDFCGNTASCTQVITVNDTTPPVLSGCPDNATFQCLADVPPPADVTAEDNCDGPLTPVFSENQTNPDSSCNNVITRTWRAEDSCGNFASCTQVITVNDTTGPVLTGCPSGQTLQCNTPFDFTVTADDNCDGPVDAVCQMTANDPAGSATFTSLGGGAYELVFTADGTATISCSATDTCGNASAPCSADFSADCAVGCTLTWGYWKTHGIPDCGDSANPHPDPTWLLLPGGLGTDTIFYLSGDTYCGVMLTAPKGNPYYSLAHQFIAAQLNQLAGASIPQDVLDAFTEALALFQTYTPAQVKASADLKAQFNALVGILTDYNEGLIGPGHCDGDVPPPSSASVTDTATADAVVGGDGAQALDVPGSCGPAGLLAPLATALGLTGLRRRR